MFSLNALGISGSGGVKIAQFVSVIEPRCYVLKPEH